VPRVWWEKADNSFFASVALIHRVVDFTPPFFGRSLGCRQARLWHCRQVVTAPLWCSPGKCCSGTLVPTTRPLEVFRRQGCWPSFLSPTNVLLSGFWDARVRPPLSDDGRCSRYQSVLGALGVWRIQPLAFLRPPSSSSAWTASARKRAVSNRVWSAPRPHSLRQVTLLILSGCGQWRPTTRAGARAPQLEVAPTAVELVTRLRNINMFSSDLPRNLCFMRYPSFRVTGELVGTRPCFRFWLREVNSKLGHSAFCLSAPDLRPPPFGCGFSPTGCKSFAPKSSVNKPRSARVSAIRCF